MSLEPVASRGTAAIDSRSIQMTERKERKAIRRLLTEKLREFYRLMLAQLSADTEGFWRRVQLSSMRCPSCGGQMALRRTLEGSGSGEPIHVFACPTCGLSYFTEDYVPVSGRQP